MLTNQAHAMNCDECSFQYIRSFEYLSVVNPLTLYMPLSLGGRGRVLSLATVMVGDMAGFYLINWGIIFKYPLFGETPHLTK